MSDRETHPSTRPPGLLKAWACRFGYALRGVRVAVAGESNFWVYGLFLAATIAAGAWLHISVERWCLVILSSAMVIVAEMFNTAIEHLAKAITRERRPELRDALDVASGAVLLAAIGAAGVGVIAVAWPVAEWLGG
jgi:diacylglycerol kinase